MRRAPRVELAKAERAELEEWVRHRPPTDRLSLRAQVVLLAADGAPNSSIAMALGVHPETVGRWRHRFVVTRVEGIRRDAPRAGPGLGVPTELVDRIVRTTREEKPPSGPRWTTRSLARALQINHMLVHRVWRSHGLAFSALPSPDPDGATPVSWVEVLGLYLGSPASAAIFGVGVCDESMGGEPPSHPRTDPDPSGGDGDTERQGLPTALLGALARHEEVVPRVPDPKRSPHELLVFLRRIEEATCPTITLYLFLDRPEEFVTARVGAWLDAHPRFRRSAPAPGGSWLGLLDEWFRSFRDVSLHPESFQAISGLAGSLAQLTGPRSRQGRFSWTHPPLPRNRFRPPSGPSEPRAPRTSRPHGDSPVVPPVGAPDVRFR